MAFSTFTLWYNYHQYLLLGILPPNKTLVFLRIIGGLVITQLPGSTPQILTERVWGWPETLTQLVWGWPEILTQQVWSWHVKQAPHDAAEAGPETPL